MWHYGQPSHLVWIDATKAGFEQNELLSWHIVSHKALEYVCEVKELRREQEREGERTEENVSARTILPSLT